MSTIGTPGIYDFDTIRKEIERVRKEDGKANGVELPMNVPQGISTGATIDPNSSAAGNNTTSAEQDRPAPGFYY